MYISQELRKKNIAEYLLYMWQVEDIIRAYGCSLSRLRHEYISQFDYDEEQKEDLTDWYGNLIRMMNQESVKFPFYTAEYYKVLPFIVELRNKGAHSDENEVETCLNALYGLMMLRLQKKEVSAETAHAMGEISTLMGMLSDYYLKDKTEGLNFDE